MCEASNKGPRSYYDVPDLNIREDDIINRALKVDIWACLIMHQLRPINHTPPQMCTLVGKIHCIIRLGVMLWAMQSKKNGVAFPVTWLKCNQRSVTIIVKTVKLRSTREDGATQICGIYSQQDPWICISPPTWAWRYKSSLQSNGPQWVISKLVMCTEL